MAGGVGAGARGAAGGDGAACRAPVAAGDGAGGGGAAGAAGARLSPVMDVALVAAPAKARKPAFAALLALLARTQRSVLRLDPDRDLEAQVAGAHIDVLLMKVTHLRAREDKSALRRLMEFYHRREGIVVIDPIESTNVFVKRSTLWDAVRRLMSTTKVCLPESLLVENRESFSTSLLPCICKPDNAESHSLTICRNEEDFGGVTLPSYCERLIPHNVLHKVYVVGDKMFVHPRSSIKELPESVTTFDSQSLTSESHDEISELTEEDTQIVRDFMEVVQRGLNITLFGLDIVKEEGTGKLYCIDINLFPGYTSFPNFPQTVVEYLEKKVMEQRNKGFQ